MPRAKPFSGKKKKEYLLQKREKKRDQQNLEEKPGQDDKFTKKETKNRSQTKETHELIDEHEDSVSDTSSSSEDTDDESFEVHSEEEEENQKDSNQDDHIKGNLRTVFEKEPREEIEKRKERGKEPLDLSKRNLNFLKHEFQDIIGKNYIDMPKRPSWDSHTSAQQLEKKEHMMFKDWLKDIYAKYPRERLNYFEHNLEVWRQLWRVCEKSDVICLVVDARFPWFHFPVALYHYIVDDLKKPTILVMSKVDLVDSFTLRAWKYFFQKTFPELEIVTFQSFSAIKKEQTKDGKEKRKLNKQKKYDSVQGKEEFISKIMKLSKKEKESSITVGMVGHPNVGKSSLINAMMQKKVVSTSRTPGHTKHFQTIYFSDDIILCDCPGLVFPAIDRSKELQQLCGVFPISQIREPYSAIRYLAERVPVEEIYKLKIPEEETVWSPYLIAEAYAEKRGYFNAKTGRPDNHRAGLIILRDCLDGVIPISWPPNIKEEEIPQEPLETKQEISEKKDSSEENNNSDDDDEEEIKPKSKEHLPTSQPIVPTKKIKNQKKKKKMQKEQEWKDRFEKKKADVLKH